MFEQLDEPKKTTVRVSAAMTLGILAAYLAGGVGGFLLFIVLGDRPYGIQIATVIVYTYFAFWYVFFPTRGLLEKYSLRNKTVQQQIPRLLGIHCSLLILIFLGQTILFEMKPHLPGSWLIIPFGIVFFTQVLISRWILSRSLKEDSNHNPFSQGDMQI